MHSSEPVPGGCSTRPSGTDPSRTVFLFCPVMLKSVCRSFAGFATFRFRVAADMRADCIHRDPQRPGNLRRGFPLQSHRVDSFHVLFFDLDNSPFEFAVLCVIALARCPQGCPWRCDTPRGWDTTDSLTCQQHGIGQIYL